MHNFHWPSVLGTCLTPAFDWVPETRSSKIAQVVYPCSHPHFCDNIIKKQEKTNIASGHFYPASGNIYQHYLNEYKAKPVITTKIGDSSGLP